MNSLSQLLQESEKKVIQLSILLLQVKFGIKSCYEFTNILSNNLEPELVCEENVGLTVISLNCESRPSPVASTTCSFDGGPQMPCNLNYIVG